ncbi:MAG: sugar phosphate isomerase/epimerase [Verrucomicrobiaceae bacterium]|nr:sugar phosphate isomerase/epimerase [Verrucomicrobiaceae bacterium]
MQDRRTFLTTAAAAATGAAFLSHSAAAPAAGRRNKLCAFTKHLQGLGYDQIADIAAECGLDGIEAPVRPGGHVEPERVQEDLPKLVDALKQRGLELTILTSGINQVSKEQNTEAVLRTAAKLGVKRFRMLYFKYDLAKPILPQIEEWRPLIKDLVQLSAEIGIQPLVQNHSGKDYFAAPIWDAFSIMKDYKPEQFGFAFDIYHATVEGGLSWPLEFSLVADHIGAAYFKDVKWISRGKAEGVPLGTGQASPDYAKMLNKRGYAGPVSLHTEYMVEKGAKGPPSAEFVKASVEAFQRDLGVLKQWMGWS